MARNLLERIVDHVLGRKYYCVTFEEVSLMTRDFRCPKSMSGYVFKDKETAKVLYYQFKNGKRKRSLEIVSFRSKQDYEPYDANYLLDMPM